MIGLFNDCFPPIMDGVSLTTQNYAYWLHKKTQNVCVVTPKSPEAKDEGEYPVYRYSSIPIPMRKPYRLGFPRIDWPFHERINRLSFELVHAHCPFSSGALAMQISRSQKVPIIATFHSKYRADFERAISSKLLVDVLMKRVIRFYEAVDEVWIPQASVEETLREYGYKGKVEVVDNGNDLTVDASVEALRTAERARLGINENELMFLFVGQHIWEKNLSFLLQGLSLIKGQSFKMYFVGSGYASDELKKMAASLGLSDKVCFVGSIIEREKLKGYYAAADLFLFPSLYDNAPLVVREAAALSTPSVLIKGSTSSEIINDSENGFLTENRVEDFASRLTQLCMSPQLVKQVGERAAESIVRPWEDVAEEVYDRYVNLIKRTAK
ncbi:glycosyltransferase [uncultured Bacteroides sp.]|uniref:glycosyltransferase n=1 Tax=uncultured Bacteroides sp. TaxID=162156 RepID=UPI002AAB5985|nr:glycosyltransferase [uncultured Bacteroides sp.]